MNGMARWHRQSLRRSERLLEITHALASGRGASRAGKSARRDFVTLLNCCSRSSGFADGSVISVFSACGVVLGKAGPRRAWRCSRSSWGASVASGMAPTCGVALRSECTTFRRAPHLRSAAEPNSSLNRTRRVGGAVGCSGFGGRCGGRSRGAIFPAGRLFRRWAARAHRASRQGRDRAEIVNQRHTRIRRAHALAACVSGVMNSGASEPV